MDRVDFKQIYKTYENLTLSPFGPRGPCAPCMKNKHGDVKKTKFYWNVDEMLKYINNKVLFQFV